MVGRLGGDGLITGGSLRVGESYLRRQMGDTEARWGCKLKCLARPAGRLKECHGRTGEAAGNGEDWCAHSPYRGSRCSVDPVSGCHARK